MYLVVLLAGRPVGLAYGYHHALDVARNDAMDRYEQPVPQFPAEGEVASEYGGHKRWVSLNSAYSLVEFPCAGGEEVRPGTDGANHGHTEGVKGAQKVAFDMNGIRVENGADAEMTITLKVGGIAVGQATTWGSIKMIVDCQGCGDDVDADQWANHVLEHHADLD